MKRNLLFIFLLTCSLKNFGEDAASLTIVGLTTDSHINPLGIDHAQPRFGWKMHAGGYNQEQTAYQVIVASAEEKLHINAADIWNSGRVNSGQSTFVPFKGKALQSSRKYFWKVRVWDKNGNPSAWSKTAHFVTGILNASEWKASWTGAWFPDEYVPAWQYGNWIGTGKENLGEAYYRKSFRIEDPASIEKALLRVHSGNKSYIYINGRRIKECAHWVGMYEVDVDFRLKAGKNVLAIHARDRDGNRPDITASLMLQFKDGTVRFLVSDSSWKARAANAPNEWAQTFYYDGNWDSAKGGDSTRRSQRRPEFGPKGIQLRKEFSLAGKPRNAYVHVTGLGSYQLFINGRKVSDDLLTPGWTEFNRRVEYQTYDVGSYLTTGKNTIGIMLGNAWWQFHYNNFKATG
ncbi:MAG: alpha-L-rhamnosidase N-terminal domain-containing protein, partial [Chitinophagaceae bacterium]|nr:alpha-L-rhamnosidase N-terminal domain-containing protein [Chitinophagaceae bacterium]